MAKPKQEQGKALAKIVLAWLDLPRAERDKAIDAAADAMLAVLDDPTPVRILEAPPDA